MQINSDILFLGLIAGSIIIIALVRLVVRNAKVAEYVQHQALGVNPSSGPIEMAIADADFHLSYDLKEQAIQIIKHALQEYPDNQRLLLKLDEIDAKN